MDEPPTEPLHPLDQATLIVLHEQVREMTRRTRWSVRLAAAQVLGIAVLLIGVIGNWHAQWFTWFSYAMIVGNIVAGVVQGRWPWRTR